jgi:hypothetical protein
MFRLVRLSLLVLTAVGFIGVSSIGVHSSAAATGLSQPVAAYSLVAPVGASPSGLVARAVMPAGAPCPRLKIVRNDGGHRSVPMVERKAPATTGSAFAALTACTADIPAGAAQAFIGTTLIPSMMPGRIESLAILGDTGCRTKGKTFQDCADVDAWPLAQIASSIAKDQPDVVVFTGDFFYREAACPDDKSALCGGSPAPIKGMPFKDTAYSWTADVFTPMAPMLASAPIVVTRGNHEECSRGGNGYFIYMDPREGTERACAPFVGSDGELTVPIDSLTPTFAADLRVDADRRLRLVVVDSAGDTDCEPTSVVPQQRTRFERAQQLARGNESWLLVHRPIVGWQPSDDCGPDGGWITADQAIASKGLLGPFQMVLSSHLHLAQAVNIPGIPSQFVVGNGGTLLEPGKAPVSSTGPTFPGASYPGPTSSWMAIRFGYVTATPNPGTGWTMQMRDPGGEAFATCTLASKRIECRDR